MESTKRLELRRSRYKLALGWEASGLTQSAYCRSEDVSVSVFKYWRRKFCGLAPKDVNLATEHKPVAPKFLEMQTDPANASSSSQIQISYPNGVRISVPSSMSAERIAVLATSFKSN